MYTPFLTLNNFFVTFEIETDANNMAIGGVPTQQGCPLAIFSQSFISAEQIYPVHNYKLLAIFKSYVRWHLYLNG